MAKKFCTINHQPVSHKACKLPSCKGCGKKLNRGVMVYQMETMRQPNGITVCEDCHDKLGAIQAESLMRGKDHDATWYNISHNHKFRVQVITESEEVKWYLFTQGWLVSGKPELGYPYRCNFADDSHHAITKIFDEIFTSGYELKAFVNNQEVKNTEECRDVLEMKVRNAVVNKSVKR